MSNLKQAFQSQLIAVGVPVNQATAAAEALARQSAGELPVPLPSDSPGQAHVTSGWHWMNAKERGNET